jgi:hypothetical protein
MKPLRCQARRHPPSNQIRLAEKRPAQPAPTRSRHRSATQHLGGKSDLLQAQGHIRYHNDDPRVGGLAVDDVRHKRYQKEERDLLTQVRENTHPTDFLPRRFGADLILTPQLEREALIVRAAILARKKLWALATEDFGSACAPGRPKTPLNAREIAAVRQSVFSKCRFQELIQSDCVQKVFLPLRDLDVVGVQISQTCARALVWFFRRALKAPGVVIQPEFRRSISNWPLHNSTLIVREPPRVR